MDALWSIEDKWKLSTYEAAAFLGFSAFLVIGICIFMVLRRRAKSKGAVHQEPCENDEARNESDCPDQKPSKNWDSMKKLMMNSVRWSGMTGKWEERRRISGNGSQSQRERASPLLVVKDNVGRFSHNSCSAVWQKPILMGGRCEFPRFSGLILYDDKGRPLDHQAADNEIIDVGFQDDQKKSSASAAAAAAVRTTLRDLL
ncbi:OLC1v1023335C1 [Oldenlandia corymbosa var. corymbosa]|uniref:OLC1v1023335C1 n=1 Tax=Oldenlandia corymbosa var. corymbosa TaxID=529605 RepID=A0AAV1C2J6_OLDCO|nr:OLC1v1023335C1 [Oldenlandia corymbosa var. corymbosa]